AHGSDLSPPRLSGDCGMTCPRCQQENLPAMKFCGECGTPLKNPEGGAQPAPSYADLKRSLTEALEQQTATGEILRVISTSPSDLQPVFQTIVESGAHLCGAQLGAMYHFDGQMIRFGAHHGFLPSAVELIGKIYPAPARPDTLLGRTIVEKSVVH